MGGMDFQTILFDLSDGVATITLNRPASLNAFNEGMLAESLAAVKLSDDDPSVRCIVITGQGRAFSSGQDLVEVTTRGSEFSLGKHVREGYNRLVLAMMKSEKPIIAAVNGVAAGAGLGIALAADLRIAAHKASFILAFSKVGLIPDSGTTWTLQRLIGYGRAYQMAITGEPVSAETALRWGLVNEVVPDEQFGEVVRAWALTLANGPTVAFGLTKRAMYAAANSTFAKALDYEAHLQEIASQSEDCAEGIRAFIEKDKPNFIGK